MNLLATRQLELRMKDMMGRLRAGPGRASGVWSGASTRWNALWLRVDRTSREQSGSSRVEYRVKQYTDDDDGDEAPAGKRGGGGQCFKVEVILARACQS